MTVGAVSQHIRNAEAQLGRSVFERTPRGLRATPVGVQLLASLTHGFQEIARAVAAAEARPSAVLTVSVAPVLAAKWLVPRLTRFYAAHPGLQLRIDASSQLVDFEVSDVDGGVRVGAGPWPNVLVELAGLELFPVCSPALAAQIRGLEDLRGLPIIRDHGSPGRWPQWLAARGRADLPLHAGPIYSDAALCLEAAIARQGVAMVGPHAGRRRPEVRPCARAVLRKGRLRRILLARDLARPASVGKHSRIRALAAHRAGGRLRRLRAVSRRETSQLRKYRSCLDSAPVVKVVPKICQVG